MTETTFPGFRLRRKIGTGGMGVVFEAHHLERDEIVALKVLRPHLGRDPDFVAQFIEEIRLLSALRHPAIVQVLGHGHDRDLHYIAMERVAGRSVREALRESKRLGGERASRITWEAAMALNAAHQQAAIIHGDVKPGNMLLDAQGRVKLCDFGLASVEQRARVRAHKTSSLERRGTAAYAAPERFTAQGAPSIQGDAYALGVSLFQMLTGRLPFTAGDVAGLARAHREAPVPLLAESGGPDHPALQILVERLLAKDPRRRMRDWPTLISDLALLVP